MAFEVAGDFEGVFLHLARPNREYAPAILAQFSDIAFVAGDIAFEFFTPISLAGFRHSCFATPFMTMPETAVNEDAGFVFREDDVGIARQIAAVDAKAVAHPVKDGADHDLRLGVFAANSTHHPRAMFFCQCIDHVSFR